MVRHVLAAELPDDRVVPAMDSPAFRHEIALLQQLRSVFLQEPLNRFSARFVRTDMNIANAPCHWGSVARSAASGQFLEPQSLKAYVHGFSLRITHLGTNAWNREAAAFGIRRSSLVIWRRRSYSR
jgi:hypothetical protein